MPASASRLFVRALGPAMAQASAIAAALEGRVPNVPKPGESTAVKAALTIADTASQETLLIPLAKEFRSACLEAEEDTSSVAFFDASDARRRIVIDPIDGTLHFYLGGCGPYAIMAGLAIDGRYEAALVALPREGWVFEAVRRGGAWRAQPAQAPREPATLALAGNVLLLSDGVPDAVEERLTARGFVVQRACGGAVAVAPLLPGVRGGLRIAKYETISTRGRIGLLIAAEAGALVTTREGTPFPVEIDAPATTLIVADSPEIAAQIRAALQAW